MSKGQKKNRPQFAPKCQRAKKEPTLFCPREEVKMEERVQKYLANCGIASRRKCEEYILQGRVQVNGRIVTELGTKINLENDIVKFDGKDVKQAKKLIYILLNKPIGYVTTVKDQFNRDSVLDLVKTNKRLVPVRKIRYVYIRSINTYK